MKSFSKPSHWVIKVLFFLIFGVLWSPPVTWKWIWSKFLSKFSILLEISSIDDLMDLISSVGSCLWVYLQELPNLQKPLAAWYLHGRGCLRLQFDILQSLTLQTSLTCTVTVKKLDTPHKQTNKKQPILRLLISFWFQNNRLEISFSEHIEPFNSYEYEQSYAIFSDWNDLKFLTILRFISECVVTGFPQQKKRF